MEFRVLKYFLAVAREESILGAADALHISQPTLSRQLMDLENELGKKLFTRGNRRITLTEEGMLLRKRAEEIVGLVEKTESEINAVDKGISGDIYLGCGETAGMSIVSKAIKSITDDGYDVRFHVSSGNQIDITEKLDKGLFDFALLIEGANLHKYEHIKLPFLDVWGILMRKDNPLAQKNCIRAEDLNGVSIIAPSQPLANNALEDILGGARVKIAGSYNLLYNAAVMVQEGIGVAPCLDRLANVSSESSLCFVPVSPKRRARLDIVWKRYQVFSKAAELFIERLRSVCETEEII